MPSKPAFEAANAEFYRAFAWADFDAMRRLWAVKLADSCFHPGAAAAFLATGLIGLGFTARRCRSAARTA